MVALRQRGIARHNPRIVARVGACIRLLECLVPLGTVWAAELPSSAVLGPDPLVVRADEDRAVGPARPVAAHEVPGWSPIGKVAEPLTQ
eukprot:11039099-Prorocentrum_lima.AAC.1